ncbi:MAG TPA: hypothetical protein VLB09_03195 [Nitrospiria bacterium]|nr:hypothetical protein [Nitrospiria bacterium]
MPVIGIHKPVGVTSHQVAIRLSQKWKCPVTHSGILDPMAEGVLVLLAGAESKNRQAEFQSGLKTYRFETLFGFSTDSYDALGLVSRKKGYPPSRFPVGRLREEVARWTARARQAIPPFSAKVIKGRPLFWWARQGRLKEIGPSFRKIRIESARLVSIETIEKEALARKITRAIGKVEGDFRQDAILGKWKKALGNHPNRKFIAARIEMRVSGGTYIRSIAHDLGRAMGIPAFALGIKRTQSGDIRIRDCVPFEEAIRVLSPGELKKKQRPT